MLEVVFLIFDGHCEKKILRTERNYNADAKNCMRCAVLLQKILFSIGDLTSLYCREPKGTNYHLQMTLARRIRDGG